jgi:hypothetical protein
MFRRNFLQRLTIAGTSGLAALGVTKASEIRTVTYRVHGFSCITCAVGLDTMLRDQKGVIHSKSTYPDGVVTIDFGPRAVTEKSLIAFISEQGFTLVPRG